MIMVFFFGGATTPIWLIRGGEAYGPQNGLEAFKYIGYALPGVYNNFYIADVLSSYNQVNTNLISSFERMQNIWAPLVWSKFPIRK